MLSVIKSFIVALLLVAAQSEAAEIGADARAAPDQRYWWAGAIGGGVIEHTVTTDAFGRMALLAAVSVQADRQVFTVRFTRLDGPVPSGDFALLYERAIVDSRWLVTIGAGIGLRHARHDYGVDYSKASADDGDAEVAAAWSIQVVTRKHPTAGGGLVVFGSVADDRDFVACGLQVNLGKLNLRGGQAGGP
ncbi:MAG: hypothetical protein IPH48_17805 [bacterium]|nr:hypothetical protein [bacterium]